jgi:hypothetical protein
MMKSRSEVMKKIRYLGVLVSLTMLLVACGSAAPGDNPVQAIVNEDYRDALPVQAQLTLGTMKLETTDLAVDAEQATELLTLWRAILSLSTSDITAEGEIEGLVEQILEAMDHDQLEAIAGMELTQEDISEFNQEMGFDRGDDNGAGGESASDSAEGTFSRGGPGAGVPGGGPGGGAQRPEGLGQDLDPQQIATLRAEREKDPSSRNRFSLFMINPLLQLLEERTQS